MGSTGHGVGESRYRLDVTVKSEVLPVGSGLEDRPRPHLPQVGGLVGLAEFRRSELEGPSRMLDPEDYPGKRPAAVPRLEWGQAEILF